MASSRQSIQPRRLYRSSEEVLKVLYNLPSDDESEDDLESNSDINDVPDATEFPVDTVVNNDTDSDDSDTLYYLADPHSDSESDIAESDTDSDANETEWDKSGISPPAVDYDAVCVIPVKEFLLTDGPMQFFSCFFDDDTYQFIVTETNRYARQKKLCHWHDTSVDEIKAMFGMMIAMGLHPLADITLYWSSDPMFRVQPIADVMPIKRYKKLLQAFHLNNNKKMPKYGSANFDKLYKVKPLVDHLNYRFQDICVNSSSQSVDEAMIGFKGRSSLKQYMPLKPVKRGYKVWVRADAKTGYMYQFEIYAGKSSDESPDVGLGTKVVLKLTTALSGTQSHVTFDNFFSCVTLLETLFANGILATATVRSHCTDLPALARSKNDLQRGQSKWRTRQNTGYFQWRDTKIVHVISTAFKPYEYAPVRRTQKDGSRSEVQCPLPVAQYTRRMGGVDRFDQKRSCFSVSRRSFKWWTRIFYFLLDSAVVNAHILFNSCRIDGKMSQFEFRATLSRELMGNFCSRRRRAMLEGGCYMRRRSDHAATLTKKPGVPDSIRLQAVGKHWPTQTSIFRRCRVCSSKTRNRRSRYVCSTCSITLCVYPCFEQFHTTK